MVYNQKILSKCKNIFVGIGTVECSRYQSYLQGNDLSVGSDLAEMAASFVIYFGLILLLESGKCRILWDKILLFVHNIRNTHSKSYDMVDSPNRSKGKLKLLIYFFVF